VVTIDGFLKIEGIPGESQDTKHKGEIEVGAWSWGESASVPTPGAGGGAGKVTIQPFTFSSGISKASPLLMKACASGQHIKSALFTARHGGQTQVEFLTIALGDVLVSSYQTGGGGEDGSAPLESISLNFRTIRVEYKETKPDGTAGTPVVFAWDLAKSAGL